MKFPLIKFLLFFALGTSLGIYYEINHQIFILIFFAFLGLGFLNEFLLKPYFISKKVIGELFLIIAVFSAGISISFINNDSFKINYFPKIISLNNNQKYQSLIEITEPISIKNKTILIKGKVRKLIYTDSTYTTIGKAIWYVSKDTASARLLPGDELLVSSSYQKVENSLNPGQFDYSKYLKFNQIEYVSYCQNKWNLNNSNFTLKRVGALCRDYCIDTFRKSNLKGDQLAVACALTFGFKDELDDQLKHAFSSTGAMHVLAVSGLHVGIVYFLIIGIFKLLRLAPKYNWVKLLVLLLCIWFYALITGMSSSVIRASTMLTFFIFAELFKKSTSVYNILAASAILLLVINPFFIMQVGFQLSYLAVLGILYIQPKIEKLFHFNNWISNKVWTITSVSIAAQIATFPLGLLYFHQFPNYFLISNLLVIPIAFILLVLGILLIAFSFSSAMVVLLGYIKGFILNILIGGVNWIDQLPGSLIEGISITITEALLIYFTIVIVMLYNKYQRKIYAFIVISFLSFLMIGDIYEDYKFANQKKIIIYDIPTHFAMDLIVGDNHYFIVDEQLWENKQQLLFYIKHNWYNLDLNPPEYINIDQLKNKTLIWEDQVIDFVFENKNNIELNRPLKNDQFWMNNQIYLRENNKIAYVSISSKKKTSEELEIHSIEKDGYYVKNL
jgi:competence protein ComEC